MAGLAHYANDHGIVFKQHTFIWGSQQPGWTDNLTPSNGPEAVQNNGTKRPAMTWLVDFLGR